MAARSRQLGVSLIEALVALAVMGVGTMAVMGVQASLRLNGDLAKQRNEAVRIAQERVEDLRAFSTMAEFDQIVSLPAEAVVGYATANASYTVKVDAPAGAGCGSDSWACADEQARRRSATVTVSWVDRRGESQVVRLSSALHGVPPSLAATLALPGNTGPLRNPRGRHSAIPQDAVIEVGDPTRSRWTPPGAVAAWRFDNRTGHILDLCSPACTPFNARLLAGFVRFSTADVIGSRAPVPSDAESPLGGSLPPPALQVAVIQTAPDAATLGGQVPECFTRSEPYGLAYFCAVPVGTALAWSGRSQLVHPQIATSVTEVSASRYRVCRYTTRLANLSVPATMTNEEHPLDYVDVTAALVNQNFLVINAGDGAVAFTTCPSVDDATVPVSLRPRTFLHQP